ncbi:pyridoxamine 5'-phosphate oxidase family protein [Streptomyces sp. NBC_01257]|uniref:pyridoxamine 5'-phosphate oxidase family protein n=1 Tax=Streptomyces sp. NBC_01257 TaxID=2903799 RepID=UPI002DDA7688|nr:pyridoxamine 5'-phosphate oxidase family protein [Streptomyces sp. NBC_01257]WRZ62903.1 pyridoxamine 5'-phosphate oxidase family protein [Streptomyces sp. NBC_01257]
MPLTHEEREQFLAEPHVAALAVNATETDRAPLTVPIWYAYEPGGDIWIMTGRHSRKGISIAAAGRFSLMVDRVTPTVRYVSVEGPVIATHAATREQLVEISTRYLPAERVDGYVDLAWREHGEQVVIHMRPQHWLSSDLGEA